MDCIHGISLMEECVTCEAGCMDEYFMSETCPFCKAALASDGLHCASGRDDCNTGNPDDADWTPLAFRERN